MDLRIKNTEVQRLAQRILQYKDKDPIDLSRRTLARIFTNGSFEQGGSFYSRWWQNVPSEYRQYITINEDITTEYDYSQLSLHMLYFGYNREIGNEDAYDRFLDGEHSDIVKQAFNAMTQASSSLRQKPDKINLIEVDMSWSELRDKILNSHKLIEDLFF